MAAGTSLHPPVQEDPPGPRKAQGLPSAPDRGGPPGDVTLAPAPAGPAPPAPACFGGLVGPPPSLARAAGPALLPGPTAPKSPGSPGCALPRQRASPLTQVMGLDPPQLCRQRVGVWAAGSRVLPWIAASSRPALPSPSWAGRAAPHRRPLPISRPSWRLHSYL